MQKTQTNFGKILGISSSGIAKRADARYGLKAMICVVPLKLRL